MNTNTLQNPTSAPAANAGQNGASRMPVTGNLDKSALSDLLARMKPQPAADQEDNGASAQADPAPDQEAQPGEASDSAQNFTPENDPDLSQPEGVSREGGEGSEGQGEGEQEEGALEPDVQKHVTELAKLLKDGGLSIGEVKRIEKLLRGKGAAETANAELQAKVQAMESQIAELRNGHGQSARQPETASANPFGHLQSEADIRQTKRQLHEIREWCEDHADGGTFQGRELGPDDVKQMRREVTRAFEFHLPERSEQLVQAQGVQRQQEAVLQQLKAARPELFNIENPLAQRVQFFAQHERLVSDPNRHRIAVFLALGEQAFNAKAAAAKAPPPPARKASAPPSVLSTPRPAPANGDKIKVAMAQVAKDRDRNSLAKFNAARRGL